MQEEGFGYRQDEEGKSCKFFSLTLPQSEISLIGTQLLCGVYIGIALSRANELTSSTWAQNLLPVVPMLSCATGSIVIRNFLAVDSGSRLKSCTTGKLL